MKNLRLFLSALITGMLLTSCTEEIDLHLDRESNTRLIVDGRILDHQEEQIIKLKYTAPYDSHHPCPPATEATVTVFDGSATYLFTETEPGIYKASQFQGTPGKTYTLNIILGDKEYQATSTMLPGFNIDSLTVSPFPYGFPANVPHYQLEVHGMEDPTPHQFYVFQYAKNGTWNDTLLSWAFFNDLTTNGKYLSPLPVNVIDEEDDEFDIQIRVLSVDQEYLLFIDQCIFNYMPNMFFSPPPATVTGNISNGALGYFYCASVNLSEKKKIERKNFFTH